MSDRRRHAGVYLTPRPPSLQVDVVGQLQPPDIRLQPRLVGELVLVRDADVCAGLDDRRPLDADAAVATTAAGEGVAAAAGGWSRCAWTAAWPAGSTPPT
jgi:hypothetical protein